MAQVSSPLGRVQIYGSMPGDSGIAAALRHVDPSVADSIVWDPWDTGGLSEPFTFGYLRGMDWENRFAVPNLFRMPMPEEPFFLLEHVFDNYVEDFL